MKIIDPFPSNPLTSQGVKRKIPAFDFCTLKKTLESFVGDPIIRFEVNQELFNEISAHIPTAKPPRFKFLNPEVILCNRYDSIPIILKSDQVEPLKTIRKKEKA